jgi:HK97 family phage major capsid protein
MAGIEGISGREESFLQDVHAMEELRLLAESAAPFGDRMLGQVMSAQGLVAWFDEHRRSVGIGSDSFGGRMMAADVVLPSDAARTAFYGTVEPLRTPTATLLDFIPTEVMEVGAFDVLVESYTTAAAETADLATKPNATASFTDLTVKAKTIAVFATLSRPQLADVPQLGSSIQRMLQWDVMRRLVSQILLGDGTGQNLLGITNTSGIGASASGPADVVNADLVLSGIRDVTLANGVPSAVVMNPTDIAKGKKAKATAGAVRIDTDGAYGSGGPTGQTIWDLPLISTPFLPAGKALVGDFAQGCTLFVREGVNARTSDADQDNFQRNRVTVLLEGRFGFACWRPSAFAFPTLSFVA